MIVGSKQTTIDNRRGAKVSVAFNTIQYEIENTLPPK